jgi:hypothetical protein
VRLPPPGSAPAVNSDPIIVTGSNSFQFSLFV